MSINLGWFLLFTPLLSIKTKSKFIKVSLIIGYMCILLTLNSPLNTLLKPLSIIQFSWRLNTIALPLLTVCSSIGVSHLVNKKSFTILLLVLSIEGIYHLYPTINRPLKISSKTTYSDIISGKIIDEFYSAFYVRVELAGADYLPINSPNFKTISKCIIENQNLNCIYKKNYNELTFFASENSQIVLPITYYDGYYIYYNNQKIKPFPSPEKLISFISLNKGQYKLKYEENIIFIISRYISIFTLLFLLHRTLKRI